ncbi:hypothetical protein PS059_24725, partial [Shigella sonnei]|nr:hypothetical protein [Shigella sonnei]
GEDKEAAGEPQRKNRKENKAPKAGNPHDNKAVARQEQETRQRNEANRTKRRSQYTKGQEDDTQQGTRDGYEERHKHREENLANPDIL